MIQHECMSCWEQQLLLKQLPRNWSSWGPEPNPRLEAFNRATAFTLSLFTSTQVSHTLSVRHILWASTVSKRFYAINQSCSLFEGWGHFVWKVVPLIITAMFYGVFTVCFPSLEHRRQTRAWTLKSRFWRQRSPLQQLPALWSKLLQQHRGSWWLKGRYVWAMNWRITILSI